MASTKTPVNGLAIFANLSSDVTGYEFGHYTVTSDPNANSRDANRSVKARAHCGRVVSRVSLRTLRQQTMRACACGAEPVNSAVAIPVARRSFENLVKELVS